MRIEQELALYCPGRKYRPFFRCRFSLRSSALRPCLSLFLDDVVHDLTPAMGGRVWALINTRDGTSHVARLDGPAWTLFALPKAHDSKEQSDLCVVQPTVDAMFISLVGIRKCAG